MTWRVGEMSRRAERGMVYGGSGTEDWTGRCLFEGQRMASGVSCDRTLVETHAEFTTSRLDAEQSGPGRLSGAGS